MPITRAAEPISPLGQTWTLRHFLVVERQLVVFSFLVNLKVLEDGVACGETILKGPSDKIQHHVRHEPNGHGQ